MEFLDVVNERDEIIGKAPKSEVHARKLPHRIVHIFVFNDNGEMALQLRANVQFCPHHWCTAAAGHVRSGESCMQAALRELEEELGIRFDIEFVRKDFYENDGLKLFLYSFNGKSNGPFNPDPREVERVDFFPIDKIKKMVTAGEKFHPELLFILEKHFGF
jgi:isopentenyldiphosphate isomerase